jgi:Ca2+/Na+ antiporter
MNKTEIWGPFFVWVIFFLIAFSLQYFAFGKPFFWINLPAELSLWATGVIFPIISSPNVVANAKLESQIKKNPSGSAYTIEYKVNLPDAPEVSNKYLYLFLSCIGIWIICLLLVGKAEVIASMTTVDYAQLSWFLAPAFLISFLSVGLSVNLLARLAR